MSPRLRVAERLRDWLGRRTSTQLLAAIAVLAALALSGSLLVTGLAVQTDQRQQAALAALDDFAAVTLKLGEDLHPLIVSARSQSLIFRDLSDWTP